MKKISLIFSIFTLAFISTFNLANAKTLPHLTQPISSQIILDIPNGGVVKPQSSLALPLNQLLKNTQYEIACTLLSSQKPEQQDPIYLHLTSDLRSSSPRFTLNKTSLYSQGRLQLGENSMVIHGAQQNSGFTFHNLDNARIFQIHSCVATPTEY